MCFRLQELKIGKWMPGILLEETLASNQNPVSGGFWQSSFPEEEKTRYLEADCHKRASHIPLQHLTGTSGVHGTGFPGVGRCAGT